MKNMEFYEERNLNPVKFKNRVSVKKVSVIVQENGIIEEECWTLGKVQ